MYTLQKSLTASTNDLTYVKIPILGNSRPLIIQWGNIAKVAAEVTVTFPISFATSSSYVIVKDIGYNGSGSPLDRNVSFYGKTASTAKTIELIIYESRWLAIGF